jgi:NADH-quinone oxidoreductase subunit C
MPDDIKPPVPPSPEEGKQPSSDKPPGSVENVNAAPPGAPKPPEATPEKPAAPVKPAGAEKPPAATEKPPAPAAPPKPAAGDKPAAAAAPPKPAAAPPKPAGPVPLPWDAPLVSKLKRQFGSGIEALTYLSQNYLNVDRSLIPNLLKILCDEERFDYCVDITAVHYPKRERQFDIVWILYCFERNERVRVKTQIAEGEHIPSVVSIWPTANWLEREAFDMFGVRFDGHPDMKRILLPDGWKGHPLRKDYGIIQQDQEWVQINLGIESGQ